MLNLAISQYVRVSLTRIASKEGDEGQINLILIAKLLNGKLYGGLCWYGSVNTAGDT